MPLFGQMLQVGGDLLRPVITCCAKDRCDADITGAEQSASLSRAKVSPMAECY
jgi:hypothetical protein